MTFSNPRDNSPHNLRAVRSARERLLESMVGAITFLILFAWLANGVFRGNFEEFDLRVRASVHQFAGPMLTTVMRTVTFLGSFPFLVSLLLVLIVFFYLLSLRRSAAWLVAAMAGEQLLEGALKLAFHRARPQTFFGPTPSGFSFPSGHAMAAFCFYMVLAGLLGTLIPQRPIRILIWTVAAALVLAIGLSRIYLGVHYPSDVIAGYCASGAWVSTLLLVVHLHRHRSTKHARQTQTAAR